MLPEIQITNKLAKRLTEYYGIMRTSGAATLLDTLAQTINSPDFLTVHGRVFAPPSVAQLFTL